MPCPPHPRLRNRHSLPRAVSNGAHPSDYAARELWTAIPCDSLEYRRVVPTSESPTTHSLSARVQSCLRSTKSNSQRDAVSIPIPTVPPGACCGRHSAGRLSRIWISQSAGSPPPCGQDCGTPWQENNEPSSSVG